MVQDFPESRKLTIGKPNEDSQEDRQKSKGQGRVFSMTH